MAESESGAAFLAAASSMTKGDAASQSGSWAEAAAQYREAIAVASNAPGHDWDQRGFVAMLHCLLSTPLVQMGDSEGGLRAADVALEFFDRHGNMYPAETQKWLQTRVNKATALITLARSAEALKILDKAESMLPSVPQTPARDIVKSEIARLKAAAQSATKLDGRFVAAPEIMREGASGKKPGFWKRLFGS